MAKIGLVETGFSLIPEGKYTFKITNVEYNEDFGKMKVEMQTKSGQKHTERYALLTKKGEMNEGAYKAFSFFAKAALNNFSVDEIDSDDLVGCYIKVEVEHVESTTISEKTGEPFVNVRLNNVQHAYGFDDKPKASKDVEKDDDLDDLDDIDLDDELDA